MSSRSLLVGALAGVAAGAVLSVLFSTDERAETIRNTVKAKSGDLAEDLKCRFNDFVDDVTENLSSAKSEGMHLIQKGIADMLKSGSKKVLN